MRVAVLHPAGTLTLEERSRPSPEPKAIAVEIGAVGICGSDLHYYEHGRIGDYVVEDALERATAPDVVKGLVLPQE